MAAAYTRAVIKPVAMGLVSLCAVLAACSSPQPAAETGDSKVEPVGQQPVHAPMRPPMAPAEASDGITVISVPAVVTVVEARSVGKPRDDIRPMEKTVPLSGQGQVPVPGAETAQLDRAAELLERLENEPLPEGLISLFPEGGGDGAVFRIEDDHVLVDEGTAPPMRIAVADLFSNAADVRTGYDPIEDRALVFALTGAESGATLPLVILASPGAGPTGSWYAVTLKSPEALTPARAALDLVVRDQEVLYLVTSSPPAETSDPTRRSVWIVERAFYDGCGSAITRIRFPAERPLG